MRITHKKFSTKKSSTACLLSILLSATALTAPILLTGTSHGMEVPMTDRTIIERMTDVLNSEINKNNTHLQIKEIQSTTFNADNSVKTRSSFNLGNIQNNIYNVMWKLSQGPDFNNLQTLATHYEDNEFLVKLSEKIQSDFDFCAKLILAQTEERRPLDTAERVFLFHSLTAYGIYSEAYRETFATVKRSLAEILADAKRQGDIEINLSKAQVELKKSEIEHEAEINSSKINRSIDATKIQLQDVTAIADKNSLQLTIKGFETDLKESELKKLQNLNTQNKILTDKMKENQAKIATLESEHKNKIKDFTHKLSFIFETKGKNWLPTKTVSRLWNGQSSARTDYEYYNELDLLLHQNPSIMPIARARFFHFLLNDYKDTTQGHIKRKALESLLDLNDEDRQVMKELYSKEQESHLINSLDSNNVKIEENPVLASPVTNNNSPKQGKTIVEPAIKSDSSTKVIQTSKLTQEEANVTNDVASKLVEASTQKKKSAEQHSEPQKIEIKEEAKEPLPTVIIYPQKQETLRPVNSSNAMVLVGGSSADQKKNVAQTVTTPETRFGRNHTSKSGNNGRRNNTNRT